MARPKAWELNVRPQADGEDEYDSFEDGVDYYPEDEHLDASEEEAVDARNKSGHDAESASEDSEAEEDDEEDGEEVQNQISRTSFGALKQAQDALSKKRKRDSETNEDQEEKLAALRSRLKDLKSKSKKSGQGKEGDEDTKKKPPGKRRQEDVDGDDSDSAPSEEGAASRSRTSKHAPAAQSSKYQVSRKRNVIDVPKRTYRDPRFDALHHQPTNLKDNSEKAYAFLNDYQRSEVQSLKAAIKASKNEDEKETLRRKMVSMENRLKAKAAKERERDIMRKHRREEREKVEQGKQPYYLKQKEVKEKALEEKFKGMKGKEREKLMERRRRKEGQREKKKMPSARRVER